MSFHWSNLPQKPSKNCDILHKPPPKKRRLGELAVHFLYINPKVRLINRNITLLHCSHWRGICCIERCYCSSKFDPLRMSDLTAEGYKFILKQSSSDILLLKYHLHSYISEIVMAKWNFCQRSIIHLMMDFFSPYFSPFNLNLCYYRGWMLPDYCACYKSSVLI